jgi:hypothetical protein
MPQHRRGPVTGFLLEGATVVLGSSYTDSQACIARLLAVPHRRASPACWLSLVVSDQEARLAVHCITAAQL